MNTEGLGGENIAQDSSELFDLSSMSDAGVSEEMEQAEEQAQKVSLKLNYQGHRSAVDDAEIYAEANLPKRARKLAQFVIFKHFKKTSKKEELDIGPQPDSGSSLNMYVAFDALFDKGSGRVPFPHVDTFRGRHVDHRGEPIKKLMDTREIEEALDEIGLSNPKTRVVQEAYEKWALTHFHDPVQSYIKRRTPEWDGKERLESALIDLFKPNDTPLTRTVGKYFWLSLYNRIMSPGCVAQLSIALIGDQFIGKSYFSILLCRTLMGQPDVLPVLLDLGARDYRDFLRTITGQSIIANVGEMTGMKHGDLNRIKEFVAKPADQFDFKFLDSTTKQRQWITIMDGNSYDGLQRDETGNRRFYPIFVFQKPDREGKPDWERGEGRPIDYSGFEDELWQIMAECRAWMEVHGMDGYLKLHKEASAGVMEFSEKEMNNARGVIKDDSVESSIKQVLINCPIFETGGRARGSGKFFIETSTIILKFDEMFKIKTFARAITPNMKSFGFDPMQYGTRGWGVEKGKIAKVFGIHPEEVDPRHLQRIIVRHNAAEELDDVEVDQIISRWKKDESGGF